MIKQMTKQAAAILLAVSLFNGNKAYGIDQELSKDTATCIGWIVYKNTEMSKDKNWKLDGNQEKELDDKCQSLTTKWFKGYEGWDIIVPFQVNGYLPDFKQPPVERFGLALNNKKKEEGYPIIQVILPGSAAQIAGLREGDVIQKIDGGSAKDIDTNVLLEKMISIYSSKNIVELEIKGTDGITRSISLKKGYVLNWSKANDPLRISPEGIRFAHGFLYHWDYATILGKYLNLCDSGGVDKIINRFDSSDKTGSLSSIAKEGCKENSYLRRYARGLALASNKELYDSFKEKEEDIAKTKESLETWVDASAGAKTTKGEDGVKYLTRRCTELKQNTEPYSAENYLSKLSEDGIKNNPTLKEYLTSKEDAARFLEPHKNNINLCNRVLADLKAKNSTAKQQQLARKNFKGYGGTGLAKSMLDQLCWAGNMANMMRRDGRRNGYAEMVGRGRLAVGNFTRTQYNNYRRYMLNNCPEAW